MSDESNLRCANVLARSPNSAGFYPALSVDTQVPGILYVVLEGKDTGDIAPEGRRSRKPNPVHI